MFIFLFAAASEVCLYISVSLFWWISKMIISFAFYLCFMVEDGEGELVYEGKKYELRSGDVVFIDCRKAYSHSTGMNPNAGLWSLRSLGQQRAPAGI